MLTDAQVYCMTSMIYFDHHLPLKPPIGKRRKQSCTPNRWYHSSLRESVERATTAYSKKERCFRKTTIHKVVINFKKLNEFIGDSFRLLNITDILDQLGNAKYFSTLDLASGYQISMSKKQK